MWGPIKVVTTNPTKVLPPNNSSRPIFHGTRSESALGSAQRRPLTRCDETVSESQRTGPAGAGTSARPVDGGRNMMDGVAEIRLTH